MNNTLPTADQLVTGYKVSGNLTPGQIVGNSPLSSATLGTNTAPLVVPKTSPTSTTADAVNAGSAAAITQAHDALQTELQNQQTTAKNTLDTTTGKLQSLFGNKTDILNEKITATQTPEFQAKQQAVTNTFNQLEQSKQAQAAEVDAINKGNLTDTGRSAALRDVTNKYALQNANLAVSYDVANRDFSTASNRVDQIAQLKMEAIQPAIDYYSQFLSNNESNLSKAEQNILQSKVDQYKLDQTNATAVADVLKTALSNGVQLTPQQVSKVNSFTNPKDAYSYLASQGVNLQANSYTSVTNPITGAQTSFNTKTGKYGASTGGFNAPSSNYGSNATSTDFNAQGVPITATGANSLGGVYSAAWDTVNGLKAPSQTSFRSTAGQAALTSAQDKVSQALFGHNFDAASAQNAFNFRNSETYQKYTANAPVAVSTITQIADLAQKLNLQGPDALNSFTVGLTAKGLNPFASSDDRSNAKALQSLLAVSQDDIGLLLGAGSGSDFKTKLGGVIFGADGNVRTTQDLASTIQGRIQSKLGDYYAKAGVTDSTQYAKLDTVKLAGNNQNQQQVQVNGSNYAVGQVYQDGSGAKWTVDANGKWTKQ